MSISKLKSNFVTGAWLTDVKHYFTKINEIIDYLNGNTIGSYKVYSALITQTGTNPPTATILQNTLGNITWTRLSSGGEYDANLIGGFPINKTAVFMGSSVNFEGNANGIFYQRITDNKIHFVTNYIDTLFNQTFVEIRVYK